MINNNDILFDGATHTYILKSEPKTILTPCTSFVELFFKKFDKIGIANKLTTTNERYIGMSPQELVKSWDDGANEGTAVHKEIEEYINKSRLPTNPKSIHAINLLNKIDKNRYTLYPETIIFSKELRLAGTVDLIVHDLQSDMIEIFDWKTSKKIEKASFGNKMGISEATENLPDCNFIHYSLQLSLYRYILENTYNVKVNKLRLLHLTDSGVSNYECPYLEDIVKKMLHCDREELEKFAQASITREYNNYIYPTKALDSVEKSDVLISLTEEQQTIVNLKDGDHLVLAPPGTGKTELLAIRVDEALKRCVNDQNMICLTFTNRAAQGMKERIEQHHPNNKVFIGNIHHFCSAYLFENNIIPAFTSILDEEDTQQLFDEAKKLVGWETELKLSDFLIYNNIRKQKGLNFPEEIMLEVRNTSSIGEVQRISLKYEELKAESYLFDFDDLLTYTYYHLSKDSSSYKKYAWIQVDEVQDLNPIQWGIINFISEINSHRVFFGDYEQAIFSFLGAKLDRLYSLERICTTHHMTINFRSPSYLLNLFNDYAKTNLLPKWNTPPIPNAVSVHEKNSLIIAKINGDPRREAVVIIKKYLPEIMQANNKQTAILVRSNLTAEIFSDFCRRANIDHFKISGIELFRRKVIKDFLAFLSCFENEYDRVSWYRISEIAGKIKTLKDSRHFVNKLFETGLLPSDFLLNAMGNDLILEEIISNYSNKRIVVFDTETTGTNLKNDDIIQIAATEIIKGKTGNSINLYLKTDKDLKNTQDIHKITRELMELNGGDPPQALSKFIEFVGSDSLLAHNISFDWNILIENLKRWGIETKELYQIKKIDSLELTKRLFPKLNSYKLKHLIKEFNLEGENTHNAIEDVNATVNLIKYLIPIMIDRIPLQKEFCEANKNVLNNLHTNFSDLWLCYKNMNETPVTFEKIFLKYKNSLELIKYKIDDGDQYYINKLLNHMKIKCGEKPFNVLIKEYVPLYKRYKESDLILGDEKVIILTVHKAKGLEFENVIIPECVDSIYPHFFSKTALAKKEDARLLYVAMSRSMKRLIITYHTLSDKGHYAKIMTPFLTCITSHFELKED